MKDFVVAAQRASEDEDDDFIEFSLSMPDGKKELFYSLYPTPEQLALYSAAFGEDSKDINIMNATVTFCRDVMEKPSYDRLMEKLHDRDDPTNINTLQQVLEYLFEESAARPTKPSSDSAPSPVRAGARSTAASPARASTRSRSTRSASAT